MTAYILSPTLYEILYVFIRAVMESSTTYWPAGLTPIVGQFILFVVNLFTSLFVAESTMVLVAAVICILVCRDFNMCDDVWFVPVRSSHIYKRK